MEGNLSKQFEFVKSLEIFQHSRVILQLLNRVEQAVTLPLQPVQKGLITNQPLTPPPDAAKIAELTIEANGLIDQVKAIAQVMQHVDVAQIVTDAQNFTSEND